MKPHKHAELIKPMNKQIKKMAKQSGMMEVTAGFHMYVTSDTSIERFAELVRQDEREACAKLCDEHLLLGNKCARAIRARGKE